MTIQNLELNFNLFDESDRVYKDRIQANFNLIEAKLKELLNVEYNLPSISNVNNVTVNDINYINTETPISAVFNLKSFMNIYKMYYIPYDLIRHGTNTFSFKFLDEDGIEHLINNFTATNPSVNRYLRFNTEIDTVENVSSVNVSDYVIAYYDYNVLNQEAWVFNIEPYPFRKSIIETLMRSKLNTNTIQLPPTVGEFNVLSKGDNGFAITTNPNTIKITEII